MPVGVGIHQPAVIMAKRVRSFFIGQKIYEIPVRFGENVGHAVDEPIQFGLTGQEYATQNQCPAAIPVGDGIDQGQC